MTAPKLRLPTKKATIPLWIKKYRIWWKKLWLERKITDDNVLSQKSEALELLKGSASMCHRGYFLLSILKTVKTRHHQSKLSTIFSLELKSSKHSLGDKTFHPSDENWISNFSTKSTRLNFNYLSSTLINFHFGLMLGRGWAAKLGHKRLRELICIIC